MKIKRVLKFYFAPERTEQMIDRQILKRATCVSSFAGAEQCAQGVIRLIEKKRQLCMLWQYLDGIMSDFSSEEAEALKTYAGCRRPERSRRTSAGTRGKPARHPPQPRRSNPARIPSLRGA